MRSTLAQAGLAAVLTAGLYMPGLAVSPPHLLHDEIKFAVQAHTIATTGRDSNGRRLAVYFPEPGYSAGRDPVCIYATAGALALLPLSESSIRLPSTIVGALGVALVFVLARRLFARTTTAWTVAAILALTPTYYIHSRLALSVIYPIPFVVAWLLALQRYISAPRPAYAAACGAILGAGVYSYLGAAVMMPGYLAATLILFGMKRDWRGVGAGAAAFAVTLIPVALWQLVQPDRYADIITAYRLFEARPRPGSSVVDVMGMAVRERLDTFWDSFNPSRLFFTGESSLQISTRQVGSFLLPVAVFLGLGVRELLRTRPRAMAAMLLFGLFSAPLPGVIMNDVEIRRWLLVTPIAAVVAGFGVDRLLGGGRARRLATAALVLAMAWQFAGFTRDYFGPYRERASFWFGGNIRGAVEIVLDDIGHGSPPAVYISSDIPWVEAYWRFYAIRRNRPALIARAQYIHFRDGPPPATAGALAIAPAQDAASTAALEHGGWTRRHLIADLDGTPAFVVYGA